MWLSRFNCFIFIIIIIIIIGSIIIIIISIIIIIISIIIIIKLMRFMTGSVYYRVRSTKSNQGPLRLVHPWFNENKYWIFDT